MRNDIRMKDGRDADGTGFITIEEAWYSSDGSLMGWSEINETWYYKGEPQSVRIMCDKINEVSVQQFTKQRMVWNKKQIKNEVHQFLKSENYNMTVLTRNVKPLKTDDCDC